MHLSTLLAVAAAVACTSASPVDMLNERAATTKTSSSSYVAAYPYTASGCAVTPLAKPSPVFHCNEFGGLKKPSVLADNFVTGTYNGCADICQASQQCISFGFDFSTTRCVLYDLPLTNMEIYANSSSTVKYANRHCFTCSGTTSVPFTVIETTTVTQTTTAKTTITTTTGKTTGKTTTGKTTKTTKTKASPTPTYTAGPVNIVNGGDFAGPSGPSLGDFDVSLTSASGSFSPNGKSYAYCCTSQLLGVDAACVLTQTLATTVGDQYNVDFYYKFVNQVTGLSTITAPFQGGVIQQVLGGSTDYQLYSSRYYSLTNASLFAIVMDVPLGGNAVCLTNISVSAF